MKVHEETGTTSHLVLPRSDRLTDAELASVSGGNTDAGDPDAIYA